MMKAQWIWQEFPAPGFYGSFSEEIEVKGEMEFYGPGLQDENIYNPKNVHLQTTLMGFANNCWLTGQS